MSISQNTNMLSGIVSSDIDVSTNQAPPFSLELDFVRVSHNSESSGAHVLFSPIHYESGYSYPLIVWLHGPNNDERQIMRVMPMISMRNYVAIAPQGILSEKNELSVPTNPKYSAKSSQSPLLKNKTKSHFTWPQNFEGISASEQRVFDCIEIAKNKCNIASEKIFIAGFGSGGTMAFRIGMMFPEVFAGILSFCGAFPKNFHPLGQWNKTKKLESFLSVGQESTEFTPNMACENLKLFHIAALSVSVRQYPCAQELSTNMLQDANRWIMERVCK